MTAVELASWLAAHNHVDVDAVSDVEVRSTYGGRRRRYVLANERRDQLVGGDYWQLRRDVPR